ncbi:MAG: hypothetical protein AABZ31_06890 [Bdellovibrionota bacterium]
MLSTHPQPKWALFLIALLFSLSFSTAVLAEGKDRKEILLRTGFMTGEFQGQDVSNGTFTTDVNIQGELWLYSSPRKAWMVRANLANESGLARARYFGAGLGQRFFFRGDSQAVDETSDGDFFQSKSTYSLYAGWDASLAQFLVVPFGSVLSSYSTLIEAGATGGLKKSVSPNVNIDACVSYSFGSSVASSVSVTATILKVFVGVGYTF